MRPIAGVLQHLCEGYRDGVSSAQHPEASRTRAVRATAKASEAMNAAPGPSYADPAGVPGGTGGVAVGDLIHPGRLPSSKQGEFAAATDRQPIASDA